MGTFALTGKLGLDSRDFVAGAKKAEQSVAYIGDELDELPKTAKKSGGDAGTSLGGSLKSAFAAAGVGAAVGMALKTGLDVFLAREDATRVLIGQFGKTADEANKYGKMAGNLYSAAWGDSLSEVAAAIGAVDQRLVQTGEIGEASVEGITEKAMALSDTFGEDVTAVVRSVSQLMLNDLAPSADVAFDLITVGMQNGANAAGDLFDSVDEYSQHFSAFGLSAEDMMATFTHGMQNGQRDTDKLADAVKEFRIRAVDGSEATRAAYDRLGLSTEDMADKISRGGESARDAFIEILERLNVIEDPIDRNTVGVALLGTMFEDLGPKGVDSLLAIQQGLEGVEGASEDLVNTFATTENRWEAFKRNAIAVGYELVKSGDDASYSWQRVEQGFWALQKEGPRTFEEMRAAVIPYVGSVEEADDAMQKYVDSVDAGTAAGLQQTNMSGYMVQGYVDQALAAQDAADRAAAYAAELNDSTNGVQNFGASVEGSAEASRIAAESLDAQRNAMTALHNATLESFDSSLAFRNQQARTAEEVAAAAVAMDEAAEGSNEYAQAARDAEGAVLSQASAAVAAARDQAALTNTVLTAEQETAIYRAELVKMAGYLHGPARAAVQGHIDVIDNIPDTATTDVRANTGAANAAIDTNKGKLLDLDGRVATTTIITRRVTENIIKNFQSSGNLYGVGNSAGGWPGNADGTDWWRGGPTWVGERGPELLNLPRGSQIIPHDRSVSMMSRSVAAGPSAMTPPPGSSQPTPAIANGNPGSMVDPVTWGRQAADAYSRRLQHNGRAA